MMDNPSDELDIQPIIDSEAERELAEKMEDMLRHIRECLRKAWGTPVDDPVGSKEHD